MADSQNGCCKDESDKAAGLAGRTCEQEATQEDDAARVTWPRTTFPWTLRARGMVVIFACACVRQFLPSLTLEGLMPY